LTCYSESYGTEGYEAGYIGGWEEDAESGSFIKEHTDGGEKTDSHSYGMILNESDVESMSSVVFDISA